MEAVAPYVVPYRTLAERVVGREPRCGTVRVVCVDGPSGSGKTVFAEHLARALGDAPVVHMDDLYDGWERGLGPGLVTGLRQWLLEPWGSGLPGRHPVHDWAAGGYGEERVVPVAPAIVLEGVGAASRGVRERACLVVWVEAPGADRLARVLRRDGAALRERMLEWQAREQEYLAAEGTRAAAEILVDGSSRVQHDPRREFVTLDA